MTNGEKKSIQYLIEQVNSVRNMIDNDETVYARLNDMSLELQDMLEG